MNTTQKVTLSSITTSLDTIQLEGAEGVTNLVFSGSLILPGESEYHPKSHSF